MLYFRSVVWCTCSYTFEQVQEKAAVLWKYNYYAVVYEHFDRPYIPLFGTIYHVMKHCACCKRSACFGHPGSDFSKFL